MMDILDRLRIEQRREPYEPIWADAIEEIKRLRKERTRLVSPVANHRYDDVFKDGVAWLDSLD